MKRGIICAQVLKAEIPEDLRETVDSRFNMFLQCYMAAKNHAVNLIWGCKGRDLFSEI